MNSFDNMIEGAIITLILAIVGTILAYIFIIPEKKKEELKGFLLFLHDTFNFKYLVIEKILKCVYVFLTIFTVVSGIVIMFSGELLSGLLSAILSPIVIRIAFELLMMTIIAIRNIIEINNKMKSNVEEKREAPKAAPQPAPRAEAPRAQAPQQARFCTSCGSLTNPDGSCSNPNCPKHN